MSLLVLRMKNPKYCDCKLICLYVPLLWENLEDIGGVGVERVILKLWARDVRPRFEVARLMGC